MRTTVTLDPDTESLVRRLMKERKVSFKRALNDAIRAGGEPKALGQFETRVRSMGTPRVDLDRALQVAAADEDAELTRRLRSGR